MNISPLRLSRHEANARYARLRQILEYSPVWKGKSKIRQRGEGEGETNEGEEDQDEEEGDEEEDEVTSPSVFPSIASN